MFGYSYRAPYFIGDFGLKANLKHNLVSRKGEAARCRGALHYSDCRSKGR